MIRERVEKIVHDAQDDYVVDKKHMPSQGIRAQEILAITNPPLTVTIPCDKCGGSGCDTLVDEKLCYSRTPKLKKGECDNCIGKNSCTCTDGKVEREIEWAFPDAPNFHDMSKPLHLHDLIDPDVAYGYWVLANGNTNYTSHYMGHDKGTLRIREAK